MTKFINFQSVFGMKTLVIIEESAVMGVLLKSSLPALQGMPV